MSIHLMKDEEIVWSSFPGRNYRLFILARDLGLGILSSVLSTQIPKMMYLEFSTKTLFIMASVIFALFLIFAIVNQITFLLTRYYLTTERVVIKKGILNRRLTSLKYEHIIDTKIKQPFQELVIKTGSIYIFNANDNYSSLEEGPQNISCLKHIDNPYHIHSKLEQLIENDIEN